MTLMQIAPHFCWLSFNNSSLGLFAVRDVVQRISIASVERDNMELLSRDDNAFGLIIRGSVVDDVIA